MSDVYELNETYLSDIVLKVDCVQIDSIDNIDIEEQIVPLVIAPGSVVDKRASYDFEGGISYSAKRGEKLEFKFYVSFYGSTRISKSMCDVDLVVLLDEPMNEDFIFLDGDGNEDDLTIESLFEIVKETEGYEETIYSALPDFDSLIQGQK